MGIKHAKLVARRSILWSTFAIAVELQSFILPKKA
jgi:hypothetical protein